jgi:hypothetical protein
LLTKNHIKASMFNNKKRNSGWTEVKPLPKWFFIAFQTHMYVCCVHKTATTTHNLASLKEAHTQNNDFLLHLKLWRRIFLCVIFLIKCRKLTTTKQQQQTLSRHTKNKIQPSVMVEGV